MDSLAEWKTYWWDVTATSFNWAVDIWPWQTVLFGVVIVAITTWVSWRLGKKDEVKNLAREFSVSLVVSIAAFVLFVILVGPFLHSEGIKSKLTELEALRTEKTNFDTATKELEAQRDDVTNRLKLSLEATDIQNSEIGRLRADLDGKVAENQSLREEIRVANASVFDPVFRFSALVREDPNDTWLVIGLANVGNARTNISSTQTTIIIGGQRYSQKQNNSPILLQSGQPPFEFITRLPKGLLKDLKEEKNTLSAIFRFTFKGILGKEHVGCYAWDYNEHNISDNPHEQPEECKRKASQS